ncbi:hypothetical protein ABZ782_36960 [Streptomyces asoensis]|uniref:hypothetical protein n=1 Tax=Streptomyces asoensis TaxID=249586 RepID=UPI0033E0A948
MGVWVLRRRYLFPGGWSYTFSQLYEGERASLSNARHEARNWDRRATQEESSAQQEVASAKAEREQRLRVLEQQIAVLRHPGSGGRVDALGELILCEHLLVVKSANGTRSIHLAGLDVRFEMGQRNHSIYCTDAAGQVHRAKYPHQPSAADPQEQRFDEDRVRDFAVAIQNTVAAENSFRARLPVQLKETESELDKVRADTTALDDARQRLSRLQELNRLNPQRKAADAALEKARRDWEELTSRLPPK